MEREKCQQEKLVTCLQNLCDKVRDKVEEEMQQRRQLSQEEDDIDVKDDDIPLIDDEHADVVSSPVPARGSVVKRCSVSRSRHISLPVKVLYMMLN